MDKSSYRKIALKVFKTLAISFLLISLIVIFLAKKESSKLELSFDKPVAYFDREGQLLSKVDYIELSRIPLILRQAVIASEDRDFYKHKGISWKARLRAAFTNIRYLRVVSGGSTITEQIVRMEKAKSDKRLSRNFFNKIIETFEAVSLEQNYSKDELLEYYLNNIPYGGGRYGIASASPYYFSKELFDLQTIEYLALAVMIRAPTFLNVNRNPAALRARLKTLADYMYKEEIIAEELSLADLQENYLNKEEYRYPSEYFYINFIKNNRAKLGLLNDEQRMIRLSLSKTLQNDIQSLLDNEIAKYEKINNGGVLVANKQGEILAWVSANLNLKSTSGRLIDAVSVKRQAGSTLKPFLYAQALEKGLQVYDLIEDKPIYEKLWVASNREKMAIHYYRNYSSKFYGNVTMREALGNSLNIPAVNTLHFVGGDSFVEFLGKLGFSDSYLGFEYFGSGVVLGNISVSLYELVQAYLLFMNEGIAVRYSFTTDRAQQNHPAEGYLNAESIQLISDVLSDKSARMIEFSAASVLDLPWQVALKTGTSSDYRDAWIVAYDSQYVIGIWLGNLDGASTEQLGGMQAAGSLMRSIFSAIYKNSPLENRKQFSTDKLQRKSFCIMRSQAKVLAEEDMLNECNGELREEFYMDKELVKLDLFTKDRKEINVIQPIDGMAILIDARYPKENQALEFQLENINSYHKVEWILNDNLLESQSPRYLWQLSKGNFILKVKVFDQSGEIFSKEIKFSVI